MTVGSFMAYIFLPLILDKYYIFSNQFLYQLELLANNIFRQSTPRFCQFRNGLRESCHNSCLLALFG